MFRKKYDYDLVVIGSGSGGGVGANVANAMGKKVAIIEKEAVGGECPNWGCVPTKALLHAADVYTTTREGRPYGTIASKVSYNYRDIRNWKDLVVSRTGSAIGRKIFTDEGIDFFKSEARFVSPHELELRSKTISAANFLIATGTTNFVPPIPGLEQTGYISFKEAIDLEKPPRSLFILGGGPIGCEFAQVFSAFGTRVYIGEAMPRLLAREDPEVGDLVGAVFESRGVKVLTGSLATSVDRRAGKKVVHYKHGDELHEARVDEILVATGMKPNTQIGLESAGVEYDRRGIKVNKQLQTTQAHIYAAGDVVGPYQFTHTASYQSRIAAHNIFSRRKLTPDYSAIPRCVFTSPEVATVGMTEEQAKNAKIKYKIGATPIEILGRANTSNETVGFVKVLTDKDDMLIGAAIVSPRAGEMIHELTLAIRLKATAQDIVDTVHAFPTFSEAVKFACASVAHPQ